ncbi:MAG: hypothetical protein AUI83_15415 [Armatimonadetes bacterium 13_1_40CM_3_65_7]|nr:MAG: hypothetical protein AUI83_15415 [Armatimonadetes bacterium 13_1_40CM_3_65_7]
METPRRVPAFPRSRDSAIDRRLLLTATAAHFLNDFHVAFLAPLLPLVVVKFNLSLALAGLLATVLTTSAALSQPVFGIVADRLRRRIFVMLGPALTVLAMGLMGLAPTYALLLALLLVAGTGTASFHPQGASTAGEASGDRRGTGLSLFVAGGELGYSLGPLIVALVVAVRGLEATWLVALPGLGACLLLWRSIPIRRDPPRRPEGHTLTSDLAATFGPLAVLWLVVVLRTIVISGYQTFLPLLLHQRGGSIVAGGAAVFLFGGIGAIGRSSQDGGALAGAGHPVAARVHSYAGSLGLRSSRRGRGCALFVRGRDDRDGSGVAAAPGQCRQQHRDGVGLGNSRALADGNRGTRRRDRPGTRIAVAVAPGRTGPGGGAVPTCARTDRTCTIYATYTIYTSYTIT